MIVFSSWVSSWSAAGFVLIALDETVAGIAAFVLAGFVLYMEWRQHRRWGIARKS